MRPLLLLFALVLGCGSGPDEVEAARRSTARRIGAGIAMAAVAAAATAGGSRGRTESGQSLGEEEGEEGEAGPIEADTVGVEGTTRVERGSDPLPLWQVQYAVEVRSDDLWCESDDDCAVVEGISCCACAQGGSAMAVNAAAAPRIREALLAACASAACASGRPRDRSCDAVAACRYGLCRLFPTLGPGDVPPVPPTYER